MRVVPTRPRHAAVVAGVGTIAAAIVAATTLFSGTAQAEATSFDPLAKATMERAESLYAANLVISDERAAIKRAKQIAAEKAAAEEAARKAAAAKAAADAAAAEAARKAAELAARINAAKASLGSCAAAGVAAGYENGRIPGSALCDLPGRGGHQLRGDAALGFVMMNEAFKTAFGGEICLTDTYRSYEAQASARASKGSIVARPGTSNHGEGTAVDLCGPAASYGTSMHEWLRANGPSYGFDNPGWARQGGSKPEPWHWEYGA